MARNTCDRCSGIPLEILDDEHYVYELYSSYEDLKNSANNGCASCKFFLRLLKTSIQRDSCTGSEKTIRLICEHHTSDKHATVIRVSVENKFGLCYIGRDGPIDEFGSKAFLTLDPNTALMKKLIDYCVANHSNCRSQMPERILPARLIDIDGYSEGLAVQVVPGAQCESLGGRYLTLSHCWGQVAEDAPWKLTQSHLQRETAYVPMKDLPKTFRQAIDITSMLGERFIWIDSLCILQDSPADWALEAGKMADIYSGSVCTLSTATDSAGGGLYGLGDAEEAFAVTLDLTSKICSPKKETVLLCNHDAMRSYEEYRLPVNRRAWCLQERELSTLIVQFTKYQFHWTCGSMFTEESAILSIQLGYGVSHITDVFRALSNSDGPWSHTGVQSLIQKPWLFPDGSLHSFQSYLYWESLLEDFTRRLITKASDRLPALEGLAKRQTQIFPDVYAYGLWKKYLWRGVSWEIEGTLESSDLSPLQRRITRIAPSWSPLCLNREIKFHNFRRQPNQKLGAQITYRGTRLVYPEFDFLFDANGLLSRLKVKGQLRTFGWIQRRVKIPTIRLDEIHQGEPKEEPVSDENGEDIGPFHPKCSLLMREKDGNTFNSGCLIWDTPTEREMTQDVTCLFCGMYDEEGMRDDQGLLDEYCGIDYYEERHDHISTPAGGIALIPAPSDPAVFMRVGWFSGLEAKDFDGVEAVDFAII